MSLMELLTLLAVILSLLSLIIDAVRLTVEVMEKTSRHKDDDSKKIDCPRLPNLSSQSFD